MTGPIPTSNRKTRRLENKKKKMAAFFDIMELNEHDRKKLENDKLKKAEESVKQRERIGDQNDDTGESPLKKLKTEQDSKPSEIGPSGKVKLHGVELLELKKMLREKTNKIRQAPKFKLRDMGENATLKVAMDNRCPLFLSDIQHLLMYSQIGVHSPYSPARWCNLEKYNHLSNVTLLMVENMDLYHYEAFESLFPFTSSTFENKLEIISPFSFNSDIVKELSMVPLSATQMKKLIKEYGSLEEATKKCSEIFDLVSYFFQISKEGTDADMEIDRGLPATDTFSRTKLLLSGWQMIEENFPLPIKGLVERKYKDYQVTKESYEHVTAHSPMIGIDCEMCKTCTGDLELTRVSVVNEKHEVIYDTLVKPENRIVDYLTRFSGINSRMMRNVTKKLKDVQKELIDLLPNDAILVGQSLSNDLHALKLMHPYVIDTSVIYNISGDRTRKTKLQTLAREFLEEKIQSGSQGHDSSEDSLACMKLVQLKLKKYLQFGDAVMSSAYTEQRAYPDLGTAHYAISMLKQCTKGGNKVHVAAVGEIADKYKFYIDRNNPDALENITYISKNSNKEVIKHLCDKEGNYNLTIGHVRIARDQLEDEGRGREKVFKTIDKWISEVYSATTLPTLVAVVFTGVKQGGNGVCFLQLNRELIP